MRSYRALISSTLDSLEPPGDQRLAASVLEPAFVHPLFQRVLIDVVRSRGNNMPVIFDEFFVRLYRLGMQSATAVLGTNPDIAVYAKIFTSGVLPLAVTLTTDKIYKAFLGQDKATARGHSYTAHAWV
ncbi:PLP-dependent transferase [Mycena chlorophos]|uniref:PLP-dependent transferase n=1 Tax=Mycena chlorophos TaxID=658473 RepID=A0A8H6SBV4_MYCCL|nr:PLP-dependent transferase [Mycena chlorophos]